MSADRLDRLAAAIPLTAGEHALELGVGKGAFLVALLQHAPRATAEGFDRNPWFLADARAAAVEVGHDVARRVSFVETDAPGLMLAERAAALTIAMGATGILGGQAETLAGLAAATRPGGIVLFADGLWLREPPADALAAFGMSRDELADGVDGFAALGVEASLRPDAVEVVDAAEWDDYESAYAGAVERWAARHPDDPEHDAFLARAAGMGASYAAWRRDAFGYAIGRFRVAG
jgi:SAM-dependent methyltransferase